MVCYITSPLFESCTIIVVARALMDHAVNASARIDVTKRAQRQRGRTVEAAEQQQGGRTQNRRNTQTHNNTKRQAKKSKQNTSKSLGLQSFSLINNRYCRGVATVVVNSVRCVAGSCPTLQDHPVLCSVYHTTGPTDCHLLLHMSK